MSCNLRREGLYVRPSLDPRAYTYDCLGSFEVEFETFIHFIVYNTYLLPTHMWFYPFILFTASSSSRSALAC